MFTNYIWYVQEVWRNHYKFLFPYKVHYKFPNGKLEIAILVFDSVLPEATKLIFANFNEGLACRVLILLNAACVGGIHSHQRDETCCWECCRTLLRLILVGFRSFLYLFFPTFKIFFYPCSRSPHPYKVLWY